MMKLRFLVPGIQGKYRCGGLAVELQTARLLSKLTSVEVVTYRQREQDYPYLLDLLDVKPEPDGSSDRSLWIVSWGFDVPRLLQLLKGRAVAYHAHSSGYGFDLPPGVPVLAVSRNTLGYWGDRAPRNPLFLVPNALDNAWIERGARADRRRRSIDVLVQQRKMSTYVLNDLVPALRKQGLNVYVQAGWVDDLVGLFNDASVYLYDSSDYWHSHGVSEGFGLPPIEALACGCVVFSSLNHALADLMDPGQMGHQIGVGTLELDVQRIKAAVAEPELWKPDESSLQSMLATLNEETLLARWKQALVAMEHHWSLVEGGEPLIRNDWWGRQRRLRPMRTVLAAIRKACRRSVM